MNFITLYTNKNLYVCANEAYGLYLKIKLEGPVKVVKNDQTER